MSFKKHSVLIANAKRKPTASLRKYICADTGKALYTNVANKAISPFSGASYLKASRLVSTASLDKQDLSRYSVVAKCGDCKTEWSANKAFVQNNDSFNCVVCNAELDVVDSEQDLDDMIQEVVEHEEEKEENKDILRDVNDIKEAVESFNSLEDEDEIDLEDGAFEDLEEDEEHLSDENGDEADQFEETRASDAEDEDLEDEDFIELEDEDMEEDAFEIPGEENQNTEENPVYVPEEAVDMELPEGLEDPSKENNKDEEELSFNLATTLNKPEYQDKIEFVASTLDEQNPSYYIMVNKAPVATAEFAKASENVKAFFTNTELFAKSLLVAISTFKKGEKAQSLKDFGIAGIKVPLISKKAWVNAGVAKAMKAIKAEYAAKEEEMLGSFKQAFSIAAMQHCKGLTKDSSLLTKSIISEALRQSGLSGQEALIEEAFQRGIIKDFDTIVTEAWTLKSKSHEIRDEMAKYVSKANYQETLSSSNQASKDSFEPAISSKYESAASLSSDYENIPNISIFDRYKVAVKGRSIR